MAVEKLKARKIAKEKRNSLSENEIKEYSALICEKFLKEDFYKNADVIYTYVACGSEINTDRIIEKAWEDGKKIAVPKVLSKGVMEFYYIKSFDDLKSGFCDIKEPDIKENTECAKDENVLIVVPGLAFDNKHNRIGYGGGYYDRYLKTHRNINFIRVSLAYDFQLFDSLIVENHDEKIDALITCNGLI